MLIHGSERPPFGKTKILWGHQMHFRFPWIKNIYINGQFNPPAPPTCCYYYFFRICMDYTLCVPHLCETQKYETKKMTKALQRTKNYVGEILITSFKLPVLSCSQLLKITGLKKTIYNVLALDRCSTCVTVLIYETKMVTVNYVFLCAFFFCFF